MTKSEKIFVGGITIAGIIFAIHCMLSGTQARGQEIQERIYDLPTFSHKCYLTVVYRSGQTPDDQALYQYLHSNPSMRHLEEQTVFNQYTYQSPIISRTQWQTYLGGRSPAILLQAQSKENGRADVIFFDGGPGLEKTNLPRRIQNAINSYIRSCPDCFPNRPKPKPEPSPEPLPDSTPEPAPLMPTIVPDEEPAEDRKTIPLVFFLAPALGWALALRSKVREN